MKKLLCLILSAFCIIASLTSCANTQTTATTSTTEQKNQVVPVYDKIYFHIETPEVQAFGNPADEAELNGYLAKYREAAEKCGGGTEYYVQVSWVEWAEALLTEKDFELFNARNVEKNKYSGNTCYRMYIKYEDMDIEALKALSANKYVSEIIFKYGPIAFDNGVVDH